MVGVVGPAGRLVFDYPDHQGTYCVGRDDPLPVGSHSSDDTEKFLNSILLSFVVVIYLIVFLCNRI